jgi:ribosomal protein L31E
MLISASKFLDHSFRAKGIIINVDLNSKILNHSFRANIPAKLFIATAEAKDSKYDYNIGRIRQC